MDMGVSMDTSKTFISNFTAKFKYIVKQNLTVYTLKINVLIKIIGSFVHIEHLYTALIQENYLERSIDCHI